IFSPYTDGVNSLSLRQGKFFLKERVRGWGDDWAAASTEVATAVATATAASTGSAGSPRPFVAALPVTGPADRC
ncbi:hypothetical protein PYK79_56355, partial [Streptomyces sp. ID05-04B]|nr:hypothetical protein [Streptomyces sp. ID05-04B]